MQGTTTAESCQACYNTICERGENTIIAPQAHYDFSGCDRTVAACY